MPSEVAKDGKSIPDNTPEIAGATDTLGIRVSTEVLSTQSGGLYAPSIPEFLYGVPEGKRLYGNLMGVLLYILPNDSSNKVSMAMRSMDSDVLLLSTQLTGLCAYIELNESKMSKAFEEVLRILIFSRGDSVEYNGKEYGIKVFKQPVGHNNLNQNVFYLLYLIKQENPDYLSFEKLQRELSPMI